MLRHSLRRLFHVLPGEEHCCVVLRGFPVEWVREDCTNFIERSCGIQPVEASIPPDMHNNRSFHSCFLKFPSPADAQHVMKMGERQWVPESESLEKEAFEFSMSKYRRMTVHPYKRGAQRPSLFQDAMENVMNMDVERFLMNPDVLMDIERSHNPMYRFPNTKRKQL